jgi:hypothetical protein
MVIGGITNDYDTQTELMRSWADAHPSQKATRDEEAFASKINGYQSQHTGVLVTTATLAEGVDSLLPEVDWVMLVEQKGEVPTVLGLVPFSALQRARGQSLVKTARWPVRYRVRAFPNAAMLKTLQPRKELPR